MTPFRALPAKEEKTNGHPVVVYRLRSAVVVELPCRRMDPDTRLRYHEAEGVFLGWCLMVMLIVGIGFLIIRIILEIKWRHIHSRQEVIDFFLAGAPLTRPIFRFQNHSIPRVVPNTPDVSETASGFQNPVYELANANPTAAAV